MELAEIINDVTFMILGYLLGKAFEMMLSEWKKNKRRIS